MEKLKVYIMHRIPGRVRIKFAKPIEDLKFFKSLVKKEINISYNVVNSTLVATFNKNEFSEKQVICNILSAYSQENMFLPFNIVDNAKKKSVDFGVLMSAGSLVMSGIGDIMGSMAHDKKLQKGVNVLSGGMTSLAIMGHAYEDMSRNNEIDLEVVPAMFLLRSFMENPKISTLAFALATTYGRHLLETRRKTKNKNKKNNKWKIR